MIPAKAPFLGSTQRAVEEAGHAVMSAYLGIPFSNVRINRRQKKGQVGGSLTICFYLDKADEPYIHKHALIYMAGAAAQRRIFSTREKENKHDKSLVRYVYGFLNRKPPFKKLRQEANQIFQDEGCAAAIRLTAFILETERRINTGEVKSLVKTCCEKTQKTEAA